MLSPAVTAVLPSTLLPDLAQAADARLETGAGISAFADDLKSSMEGWVPPVRIPEDERRTWGDCPGWVHICAPAPSCCLPAARCDDAMAESVLYAADQQGSDLGLVGRISESVLPLGTDSEIRPTEPSQQAALGGAISDNPTEERGADPALPDLGLSPFQPPARTPTQTAKRSLPLKVGEGVGHVLWRTNRLPLIAASPSRSPR
jgi:hypothetical protein